MHRGYIKFWRRSFDDELYLSEPFTKWQAWFDLIALAKHTDGAVMIRGILIHVPRGTVAWSAKSLAERWRWSRGKVERFFRTLKTRQQIEQETVQQNKFLIRLTAIINYDIYQPDGTTNGTANGATDGQQTDSRQGSNKNDKNEKNEKNTMSKEDFDSFWKAYPVRKGKKKAEESFMKLDEKLLPFLLTGISSQKKEKVALKERKEFCPEWKHPATWLNGECWSDEVVEVKPTKQHKYL